MRRLFFLIIVLTISPNAFAADARKNVLVIHSYYQGLEWTDHITAGIQSVFDPFAGNTQLYFEYLDSGRLAGGQELQNLADLYRFKFKSIPIDLIIASDDKALRFVRQHNLLPAPQTPVVFCGIKAVHFEAQAERAELGVFAHLNHQATLELMLNLHPDCRRILVLLNKDFSATDLARELEEVLPPFRQHVAIELLPIPAPEEIPARMASLSASDLIYLLPLDDDMGQGNAELAKTVALVTRWSPVAVYSSLDFCLGKGIVGGMITSGFAQGQEAAQMALRILSGQPVQDLPAVRQSPNQYMFDGRALERFHLKTDRLPAGSVIINPQPSFWVRHTIIIIGICAGLLLLNGWTLLLLLRHRKQQRQMAQTHAELDGRFREKSAHLQLVNQKLKKQSLTDGVTGMPNRRYVYQRLVEEVKKAQRYCQPLAALILNVDGFKQLNDTKGYLVAEQVLRDVGQMIKRTVRDIDLVGRFGGESFLVVLPNTDQGRCAADRIRKTALTLQWEQGEVKVTLSGGLAQLKNHAPAELVALAEKRLDIARSQGGNRVVVAEVDGPEQTATRRG